MKLSKKNRDSLLQLLILSLVVQIVFWMGTSLTPGWTTWAVCLPAWTIVVLTAASRIRDISAIGKRWMVRRLGLLLVGAAALSSAAAPLLGYSNSFPTWRSVFLIWGFALCWLTTPQLPPWWAYINGDIKLRKGQQA